MQYGFAIDHRTCIGCHACTVACKTEHEVPVGQFRTWVKYVDSGQFPSTTRDFGVMRCNHCSDAPCVQICPTGALFKREDGIVDFEADVCIGCKACLQACPYDALYIDADTHTAAKCNFCAHRIDDGLEPACVVVCPTESIWVGDLHDEGSAISRFVRDNPTQVRAPEQGTGPNVHYVGASSAVIDPLAAPVDDTYIWAQPDSLRRAVAEDLRQLAAQNGGGTEGRAARTTLNTAHPVVWGWKVVTYLWTKGVAAGALVLAALAMLLGRDGAYLAQVEAPVVAMAGLLATAVLLVSDLQRPERFWYLLLKPNTTSWLVKGGWVLSAGAALSFVWLVFALVSRGSAAVTVVAVLGAAAGVLVAGYTAFLFGQAEGRDLWQTPWLFWHLVAQALMVGGGALAVLGGIAQAPEDPFGPVVGGMVAGTLGHLAVSLLEQHADHGTPGARAGLMLMTRGRHARTYRLGLALSGLGLVVGLVAFFTGSWGLAALAGLVVQPALLLHEHAFVHAGQEVPLS